ncbi:MAG: hypothetical protein NVSMB44_33700 [Ktedonobacteraceae bacterium]
MKLSILYRGPLASCNYGCDYCPFAKHRETYEEHEHDRRALERFLDWVAARPQDRIAVFFTPWGEALVRKRYQEAFVRLSALPQVTKVAIQTNLSCRLDWTERCDKAKIALWTTYHPSQVARERFLIKCRELIERDVRFSVGVVGLKEHAQEIEELRKALPEQVYLWINAYKRVPDYYTPDEMRFLSKIDPLFPLNTWHYPSQGHPCHAGHTVISVDGDGVARRCHFIKTPIGNIYAANFEACLYERSCSNAVCHCHIGYVHMPELRLDEVFGTGILERIPTRRMW